MASTWGWRSPRRKLKKGNSVIGLPSGEMRVARHHHQTLEVSLGYLTQTGGGGVEKGDLHRLLGAADLRDVGAEVGGDEECRREDDLDGDDEARALRHG